VEPIRRGIEGFLRGRYGYVLIGPLLTTPRFTSEGPVVRNGVAAVVVCGKKRGFEEGMMAAMKYVPEPRTGTWWPAREGECTTWYHRPPGWEQRHNRHERAQDERAQESKVDGAGRGYWSRPCTMFT
jgi:hypothetical protein